MIAQRQTEAQADRSIDLSADLPTSDPQIREILATLRKQLAAADRAVRDHNYFIREIEGSITRLHAQIKSVDTTHSTLDELATLFQRCRNHPYIPSPTEQPEQQASNIYEQHINDQGEQIADLENENHQFRNQLADLDDIMASLQAELKRVRDSEQRHKDFIKWSLDLFSNPTIPNSTAKLVYWYYYFQFWITRPTPTGEDMKLGVEATAIALGVGKAAVRSATDRAEAFDIITRTYEDPIKTSDGKQYTPMHIMLHDVFNDPNAIEMEKRNGGKRVPRCPVCGSDDVDRYTLQYCRCCHANDWYVQPGTRNDAPYELAQAAPNRAVYNPSKNSKTDIYQSENYASSSDIPDMPDDIPDILIPSAAQHPSSLPASSHTANHITPTADLPSPAATAVQPPTSPVAAADLPVPSQQQEIRETGKTNISQSENYASPSQMPAMPDNVISIRARQADKTDAQHPIRDSVPVSKAKQRTVTCHATILLNKHGEPARKLEPTVSQRECGSTRWRWSDYEGCAICIDCWTPMPLDGR